MPKRTELQIDAFWDDIVRQVDAPVDPAVDPALTATVQQFSSLSQAPTPDAARERVRLRVFASDAETMEKPMSATASVIPFPGVRFPGKTKSSERDQSAAKVRRQWLYLAAAAVLLLAIVGGYLATVPPGERLFSGSDSNQQLLVPAAVSESDWPMPRGNAARTGAQVGRGLVGSPVIAWQVPVDGSASRAAAVVEGTVYLGSGGGYLYAFDATTGEEIWRFQGDSSLEAAPTVESGFVYIVSQAGTLYAIDSATGMELWRDAGPTPERFSPIVLGDFVYAGYVDGGFAALDRETGEERWSVTTGGAIARVISAGNGAVYVPSDDGTLYALDAADGSELWTFATVGAGSNTQVLASVVGDALYVTQPDGVGIWVLDAATGVERYQFAGPTGTGMTWPAFTEEALLVGDNDGSFYRLDPADGSIEWSFETGPEIFPAPVVVGGVMLGSGKDFTLHALDIETGAEVWSLPIDGLNHALAVADNMVFFGTERGTVYAIAGFDDGTPAAATPAQAVSTFVSDDAEFVWQSDAEGGMTPYDLEMLPDGNLAVVSYDPPQILVLSPDGEVVETWGEAGTGDGQLTIPIAIAVDAEGNSHVVEAERHIIQKFDPEHNFLLSWGGTGSGKEFGPGGIAVGPDGSVYVTEFFRNVVQKFDSEGNHLLAIGSPGSEPGQLDKPAFPTVDADGNLWVPEVGNNRISKFSPEGEFLFMFGSAGNGPGQFNEAQSVSFDPAGNIYAADYSHGMVQVFDPNGNFLLTLGTRGSGEGQFLDPSDVVADGLGNIYVADQGNRRIQKFHLVTVDQTGEAAPPEATPSS